MKAYRINNQEQNGNRLLYRGIWCWLLWFNTQVLHWIVFNVSMTHGEPEDGECLACKSNAAPDVPVFSWDIKCPPLRGRFCPGRIGVGIHPKIPKLDAAAAVPAGKAGKNPGYCWGLNIRGREDPFEGEEDDEAGDAVGRDVVVTGVTMECMVEGGRSLRCWSPWLLAFLGDLEAPDKKNRSNRMRMECESVIKFHPTSRLNYYC